MKFTKNKMRAIICALIVGIVGQAISQQIARILDGARDNRGRSHPFELIRRPRTSRTSRKGFRENGLWFEDDHVFRV